MDSRLKALKGLNLIEVSPTPISNIRSKPLSEPRFTQREWTKILTTKAIKNDYKRGN